MNKDNEIPPGKKYKWPWFVLAGFILFVLMAILWMSMAIQKEKRERGFSEPTSSSQ